MESFSRKGKINGKVGLTQGVAMHTGTKGNGLLSSKEEDTGSSDSFDLLSYLLYRAESKEAVNLDVSQSFWGKIGKPSMRCCIHTVHKQLFSDK